LAGLGASLRWLAERGVESIRAHEVALTQRLIAGLRDISGVTVYGGLDAEGQTATVSFTVDALETSEIGLILDDEYGMMCRVGLHCAPAAHRTIGTFPTGTVRFGLGAFNTPEQVDAALTAVRALAQEG
jgi:cysteine desulfurase/selenocysteine lyase